MLATVLCTSLCGIRGWAGFNAKVSNNGWV